MKFYKHADGCVSVQIDQDKLASEKELLTVIAEKIADSVTECKSFQGAQWYEAFRYLWQEVHKASGAEFTHHLRTNDITKVTRRDINPSKRLAVYRRDSFTCTLCGTPGGDLTLDHVTPLARGGSDEIENLTTACRDCNVRKGVK